MTITYFENETDTINNIVSKLTELFNSVDATAEGLAQGVKALEQLDLGDIDERTELLASLAERTKEVSARTNMTEMELLFVARATNIRNFFKKESNDFEYLNLYGEVTIGDRTLENFDEKVLENYFNKENY